MKVIYGVGARLRGAPCPKVVAVGVFDGVHRGHQKILHSVVAEAQQRRLKSAVVTFSFHPSHLFDPLKKIPHITSLEHKLRLIESAGIDLCYVIYFDKTFARQEPEYFITEVLVRRIGMVSLYVGEDFIFGKEKKGNIHFLKKISKRDSFGLHVLKHRTINNRVVSSTLIRTLIKSGDIARARIFLGRFVSVMGRVVRGEARGRTLGFPTANIRPHHEVLAPDGVYAAQCLYEKRLFPCAAYIGKKPTFKRDPKASSVEVFLFDFEQDLYGKMIEVRFIKKLRGDRKFASQEDLISAIKNDIEDVKKALEIV